MRADEIRNVRREILRVLPDLEGSPALDDLAARIVEATKGQTHPEPQVQGSWATGRGVRPVLASRRKPRPVLAS